MRLEVVFLVCCACVIQGKKRGTRDSAENSVLDKSEVMDSLSLSHSSKGVLKKNKPVPKERLTSISLDPMDESCQSMVFRNNLTELKKKVKCKPRDTLVEIVAPPGIIYFPNTVLVKRCGGACNRCKCISTETKNVTFYVNTIQATKRSCSSISLPEDTKCKCGCEKKIDCPGKQRYDDVRRKCACPQDRKECTGYFKWDADKCDCVCKRPCTTGTNLDKLTCRCIAKK